MSAELDRRRRERLEVPIRYFTATGESYTVEYNPEEYDKLLKEYDELEASLNRLWLELEYLEHMLASSRNYRGEEYQANLNERDALRNKYDDSISKTNQIRVKLDQLENEKKRIERLQSYSVDELQEIYDNLSRPFHLNREMADDLYTSGKIKLSDDDLANLFGYYLFYKSYKFLNDYLDRNSDEMYLVDVSGLFANGLLAFSECVDLMERINSLELIDYEPVDISASDYIFEEYILNDYVSEDKDRYTHALSILLSYGIPLSCSIYDGQDQPYLIKKLLLCQNIQVFVETLEFKSFISIKRNEIDISTLPPSFQSLSDFVTNNWDLLLPTDEDIRREIKSRS